MHKPTRAPTNTWKTGRPLVAQAQAQETGVCDRWAVARVLANMGGCWCRFFDKLCLLSHWCNCVCMGKTFGSIMSWVYLVSAGERWRWSFLPVSQLLPCHLFLLHTDRLNCTKKSRHSIALFLLQEENKKKEKTPNCLNATFFYCTKRKEKRQTTDWVITKPNRRSPVQATWN